MKRTRYILKLFSAFLSRFKALIFAGVILGAVFFLFLPKLLVVFPFLARGEVAGVVGRFTPEELPASLQSQISLGLTTVNEQFEPEAGLAESWHEEEEGRVWTFKLGDYSWQDGKKVKAQDVNYNFADVEHEAVTDDTVIFRLKDPFVPFPSVVSKPIFRKGLLGAGDWKVTKLALAGGRFVESLNLENIKDGSRKTYRFYPSEEAARTAFKLGEVDELLELVDPGQLASWPNVLVAKNIRQDRYAAIFLNMRESLFSAKEARQALAYAIDKEKLGPERALSPISPASWAFNPQVKPYTYNPERAREFLANFEQDEISISLVTTPTLLPIADEIKKDWEAAGVKTQLQVANSPPENFQALLAIQAIPLDPDQYGLWHSTQAATNLTNYGEQEDENKPKESPRIDKLLEDGRRTLDKEERKKIYLDFQRFLVEDSPVIFLYHPATYTVTRR